MRVCTWLERRQSACVHPVDRTAIVLLPLIQTLMPPVLDFAPFPALADGTTCHKSVILRMRVPIAGIC